MLKSLAIPLFAGCIWYFAEYQSLTLAITVLAGATAAGMFAIDNRHEEHKALLEHHSKILDQMRGLPEEK